MRILGLLSPGMSWPEDVFALKLTTATSPCWKPLPCTTCTHARNWGSCLQVLPAGSGQNYPRPDAEPVLLARNALAHHGVWLSQP